MQRVRDNAASEVSSDTPYIKFFTEDFTGVADGNLTGDYSGAFQYFGYRVPVGHVYRINSLTVQISDTLNFNQTDYGAIALGLTNGVKFYIDLTPGPIVHILGGSVIKQNLDFFALTAHCRLTSFAGLAQTLSCEFKLTSDYGGIITLLQNQRIMVGLNDDFGDLVNHRFAVRGVLCACAAQ